MRSENIDFKSTKSFSRIFLDYIGQHPDLKNFYHNFPNKEGFQQQIKEKKFPVEFRNTLSDQLCKQYQGIELHNNVISSIDSLKAENTYTVTTGHQLNLYTGPVYFIYKILTSIRLAEDLKKIFPENNFVPVYWMASEDHDFEEINNFRLFGKTYSWPSSQKGAVGDFQLGDIESLLSEVKETPSFIRDAYSHSKDLAFATRSIVNTLFGEFGLVIVDGNDSILKALFRQEFKREIKDRISFHEVTSANQKLSENRYNAQVNPREINLFYLDKGIRERIVEEEGEYRVLNTSLKYTKDELFRLIDIHPEKFSPNVIIRPLYQEKILPNLAYIGGPGELSYWLQLKQTFEKFEIPFPILFPRFSALIVDKGSAGKIEKLGLTNELLFEADEQLKKWYLEGVAGEQFSMEDEVKEIEEVFEKIKIKAVSSDKTLEQYVLAERQKVIKILEETSKKIKKAEERKSELELGQLAKIKEKLFPEGGLQERTDNFLNFYINDPLFIKNVKDRIEPFNFSFQILYRND